MKRNIVLIGMPGSGKTTVGKALAEELGMGFIDTDDVIREREKKELRDIVAQDGLEWFLEVQEKAVLDLRLENRVIATGGSMVYSEAAMEHLKSRGLVIYLHLGFEELEGRLGSGRRLARNGGKSFGELYIERTPLYRKYSDITVDCSLKTVEQLVGEIKLNCNKICNNI